MITLTAALALASCSAPPPAPTAAPEPTATAMPSATPAPTATAEPSPTPSATPEPTATAQPSATPEPTAAPTATPRPAARYVFPVRAKKYSVSSSHHDYPAADIACPVGSEFVAVTDGVVDFVSDADRWPETRADPDKGGLSVAIVGDDGVRYYGSHLSAIADGIRPGARVAAGQMLGLTGESGNAAGVYPQLHFGISRPTTPDDWRVRRGEVWPQTYLAAWARGEPLAPKLP